MIFFKHNDREYNIRWEHRAQETGELFLPVSEKTIPYHGTTICSMVDVTDEHTVSQRHVGQAYCVHGDQYVKEEGRRHSLRHLVSTLPREIRKAAWDAYNTRKDAENLEKSS